MDPDRDEGFEAPFLDSVFETVLVDMRLGESKVHFRSEWDRNKTVLIECSNIGKDQFPLVILILPVEFSFDSS